MSGKARAKKRILVVDDEPEIRNVCRRALTLMGLEVEMASDGEEAQRMAGQHEYDLYLVDIRMPVLNGTDFYRWLESERPLSAKRVIFMTGSTASEDTAGFIGESGRLFLLKPFSIAELEQAVRNTLKGTAG